MFLSTFNKHSHFINGEHPEVRGGLFRLVWLFGFGISGGIKPHKQQRLTISGIRQKKTTFNDLEHQPQLAAGCETEPQQIQSREKKRQEQIFGFNYERFETRMAKKREANFLNNATLKETNSAATFFAHFCVPVLPRVAVIARDQDCTAPSQT